jgi:BirA family biotin operon repressor/biotin-[acetyl-CoA-carboxylase] ligase
VATLYPRAPVESLTVERVQAGLDTLWLGRHTQYIIQTGSTNDLVKKRAQDGAPEGLLILTEEQTAGRGRRGHTWQAPLGSSLLCSVLLRPTFLPPERAFLLTALSSLAISEAVTQTTGLEVAIKWPNDLLLDGRKFCGILVDLEGQPGRLEWAILGWGLNVNVDFGGDRDLAGQATSLAIALGRPLARLPLLWACLEHMESRYEALRAGQEDDIWAAWRERLSTLGQPVEVVSGEERFKGRALDVTAEGTLLVRLADGTVLPVLAGNVSVQPAFQDHDRRSGR